LDLHFRFTTEDAMRSLSQFLLLASLLGLGGCSGSTVVPAKLRHLNPETLGAAVDNPRVEPLLPAEPGAVEPSVSHLAEGSRYQLFTLRYPKEVGFEPARAALNQLYGEYEMPKVAPREASWLHRQRQLAIKLTEEDDAIQVIYSRPSR
jgi:hypothetical protein